MVTTRARQSVDISVPRYFRACCRARDFCYHHSEFEHYSNIAKNASNRRPPEGAIRVTCPEASPVASPLTDLGVNPAVEGLWALVPVKALTSAKQRLQHYLGPEREELAMAMLTDVLDALATSEAVVHTALVTADPRVAELALQRGLLLVEENGNCEMNVAIALGVDAIRQNGGRRVVIVHADIPLLTGTELDRMAGVFQQRASGCAGELIAISPSADRGGTNCLFMDVKHPFEFSYGANSFTLHCASADARGAQVVALDSPTTAMDIDEPEDVATLLEYYRHNEQFQRTETWKFLHHRDRRTSAAEANEV
jgi:2-phospho-L-lactate guanylyltransferase